MAEFVSTEKVPVYMVKSLTGETSQSTIQDMLPGKLEICQDK
jgi:hypothetical protein